MIISIPASNWISRSYLTGVVSWYVLHFYWNVIEMCSQSLDWTSLVPEKFDWNLNEQFSYCCLVIVGWNIFFLWFSLDLTDDKSVLIRVMGWCNQVSSQVVCKFLGTYCTWLSHDVLFQALIYNNSLWCLIGFDLSVWFKYWKNRIWLYHIKVCIHSLIEMWMTNPIVKFETGSRITNMWCCSILRHIWLEK